jgi:hypothetical protein
MRSWLAFGAVSIKTPRAFSSSFPSALLAALLLLVGPRKALAQPYQVGDIVGTNFGLQNRFLWTNDYGQVYTPSNTTIRLHDFDGKVVFYLFFDVW